MTIREIKFRAWDNERECFINNPYLIDKEFYLTWTDFDEGEEYPGNIEQYTGLKDSEGVEIYEGDIVTLEDVCPGGPFQVTSTWQVIERYGAFMYDNGREDHYVFQEATMARVIGNIHENPELLTPPQQ